MIQKQEFNKIIGATQNAVDKYTYPVFTNKKNKPDLIASCVIIKVDNKYYLVTASHVVKNIVNGNTSFVIGSEGKLLPISGEFVSSNSLKDKSRVGNFDIAYIELDLDFISKNKITPLEQNKLVMCDRKNSPHIAFIHGFPISKNKQSKALWNTQKFKLKAYAYAGIIDINFKDWDKYNKRKDNHTCMTYQTTATGNAPTHPRGISGGGLWVIPNASEPNNYFLDSILIEYYEKNKIVFATKVSKVILFINKTLLHEGNEIDIS
jgi:hypothetical protein